MSTRRSTHSTPRGLEWFPAWLTMVEIAWAAPQVMAYRLSRMLLGGWPPNARDRREYTRMGQEKTEAFTQAWMAAALGWPMMGASAFEKTLAPVHRKVVANNRRLRRG